MFNYFKNIEELNSYVAMQWTVNGIDVKTAKKDDEATKLAITKYSEKLDRIKYYAAKLEKSKTLKENGLSNEEIKFLEENGMDVQTFKTKQRNTLVKSLFKENAKISFSKRNLLVYEV